MSERMDPGALLEEESPRRLLAILAELGGCATPGELGERAGLAPRTRGKWLPRLRAAGLVEGTKHELRITLLGQSYVAAAPGLGAGATVDGALAAFPPGHQAFLRLLLSAVVARWHLAERLPGALWPGFVCLGGTGVGKTAMAELCCHLFGLDTAGHVVILRTETEGSVLGRRAAAAGGFRFAPSPYLERPFLCLDEFDKAERPLQREALVLLQGRSHEEREGERLLIRLTVMLALNPPASVDDAYRRRSVVLNLGAARPAGLSARLRALYQEALPRLSLDDLRPPHERLPEDPVRIIGEVPRALNEEGKRLYDGRMLEPCVLGRAALLGLGPEDALDVAALAVAFDYLVCAETVCETRPGWRSQLTGAVEYMHTHPERPGAEALARAFDEHEQAQAAAGVDRSRKRIAASGEDVALTVARGELAKELEEAARDITQVPRPERPRAQGLRDGLRKLGKRAKDAHSADGLEEVRAASAAVLSEARELHRRIEEDRQTEQDAARAAAEGRKKSPAAQARERERRAKERRRATEEVKLVRAAAAALEAAYRRKATRKDEDVLEALEALRDGDGRSIIAWREDREPLVAGRGPAAFIGNAFGALAGRRGAWYSPLDPTVSFYGSPHKCPTLAAWGPGTQAILAAALRPLYTREIELERLLGSRPRAGRIALPARARPTAPVAHASTPSSRPPASEPGEVPSFAQTIHGQIRDGQRRQRGGL